MISHLTVTFYCMSEPMRLLTPPVPLHTGQARVCQTACSPQGPLPVDSVLHDCEKRSSFVSKHLCKVPRLRFAVIRSGTVSPLWNILIVLKRLSYLLDISRLPLQYTAGPEGKAVFGVIDYVFL